MRQKGEPEMKKSFRRIASAVCALALLLALAPAAPAVEGEMIDLNAATEEQLTTLPGVGPSKAKAIVEYRQATPFRKVEEVMNVRGFGESTFESLKEKITVGAAESGAATR